MDENLEFYKKEWVMWLTLFFFAPVGIFLMWKYNQKLKENIKIILSVVFAVFFVLIWVPSCAGIGAAAGSGNDNNIEKFIDHNKLAAQEAESKIKEIGDPKLITIEKGSVVNAAKTTYIELTSEQKGYVSYDSLKVLILAEDAIADLKNKPVENSQPVAESAVSGQSTTDATKTSTAPQAQTATETEPTGTIVYITESGKKYHLDGCSSLSKSKIQIDLDKAKSQGYTPCSNCDPPQ
ncbi:hypothetical protein [Acetobacterium wieringae]|uniref:hypothetical protein n=1 Tax=Acetobacterium wieringae TaxID=52694 RepID=UPI0020347BFB|nr:hypothetical protein [Acetobacterium wieringae]URN85825.1 hypothetical protein CHL1_001499 [Acetobacterium wieringae]